MSPKNARLKLLQEAEAEYALATKVARARGVDVNKIHLEVTDQVILAWIRGLGGLAGILFCIWGPFIPPAYQVLCFRLGMPYVLNEIYYYWPFLVGTLSFIAFFWRLVDPRTLKRITGKSDLAENEHRLSVSGGYIISAEDAEANGDV